MPFLLPNTQNETRQPAAYQNLPKYFFHPWKTLTIKNKHFIRTFVEVWNT